VTALDLLGHEESPTGIWNVAAGRSLTILDLAAVVERALGRPLERVRTDPRPGDVRSSALSAGRLVSLGWRPAVELASGIAGLIEPGLAERPVA
jgi:nucleoside-diphosphate-sugar epimerase